MAGKLGTTGRAEFVNGYLSAEHRDDPGDGCPAAGFGGDLAHENRESGAVEAYAQGVVAYGQWMGNLADVAMLVGAMMLARATAGTEVSDRILTEARAALLGEKLSAE
jgi:TetR/AcrR family transcriptional repressor of nem operon